ncbi:hypothetical protein A4G19_14355 [Pasteurellaceae bacterium Macca]|nr:hypothetical protein [Pasteurellaceae bacterium Macca]MCK3656001.1 hypothetical protein [Pasteurellaceae bacterium Macca]MCK3656022.1 hypothetical protein [Pasteurellaceae bacterium Macca]MCK3656037.1 hypothetical protein [Pasteurellaceae bacterium Macca]MCK3656069.1 hypothetical protein [Pasteurellaceae bacterium Macca]
MIMIDYEPLRRYDFTAFNKAKGRGNPLLRDYKADYSTPLACFLLSVANPKIDPPYVRAMGTISPYRPQPMADLFSMVALNGKGSPFAVRPCRTVFHPVKCYRQNPWKDLAVIPQNIYKELSPMIYTYRAQRGAGETTRTLNISFYARNFTEAKSKLQAFSPNQPPLFIKRLPVTKCSQNQTACLASQGGIYA